MTEPLLSECEQGRLDLAADLAKRNKSLNGRALMFAAEYAIQSILFLRIYGERSAHSDPLRLLADADGIFQRLVRQFADKSLPALSASDDLLRGMIRRLVEPANSHLFAGLPADFLGTLHEYFAGRILKVNSRRLVTAEPNTSRRKAGGVYYTPGRIVDYIVRHTVGQLVECRAGDVTSGKGRGERHSSLAPTRSAEGGDRKIPATVPSHPPASPWPNLTILDPACGCGAFLLGAYQYLLDWHRPSSFAERARILQSCIHGVDIDRMAVHITRLSLLLKLAESDQAGALPDLTANIRCGNGLVGLDLFTSGAGKNLSATQRAAANPFDWSASFPKVFEAGGFDVVIGNPPYLNGVEQRTRFGTCLNEYFRTKYSSARGTIDASVLFQELAVSLLRPGGLTSMIVPNKFLSAPFGAAFRKLATQAAEIRLLADFSKVAVFSGVAIYPTVYVLQKVSPGEQYPIATEIHHSPDATNPSRAQVVTNPARLAGWAQLFSSGQELLCRIGRECSHLGDWYEVAASATASEAYAIRECLSDIRPPGRHFQFITSGGIDRYSHTHGYEPIRYLKATYQHPYLPADCASLSQNRLRQYSSPKLIFAGMTRRLEAIYDDGQIAASVPTVQVLPRADSPYNLKFLLGMLNSSLINWIFNQHFSSLCLSGGYLRIGVPQIRTLPLPTIKGRDAAEKRCCDQLAAMVDLMISMHKQTEDLANAAAGESLQRQIAAVDSQIDECVFQLFALTPDERRMIGNDLRG